MSHGLFTERDFQVAQEMAWHKLTTIGQPKRETFPEILTLPVYYQINGKNVPVVLEPNGRETTPKIATKAVKGQLLKLKGGEETEDTAKEYYIPIAKDDNLPVAPPYCKGTYTLFSPHQAWDWIADVLAGTKYTITSCGMLWNRNLWFISASLDELKALKCGGRETAFQFNFSGGLDRSMSPQAELNAITIVCNNTLSASRAMGKPLFCERATKNFATKLDAAKAEVEKAVGMAAIFKAAMDSMAKTPCNVDKAREVFAGYVAPENGKEISTRAKGIIDNLTSLHQNGIGNAGKTEADLFNAYTELHTRGTDDSKKPLGSRFVSGEFGSSADAKADFYNVLTKDREKADCRFNQVHARGKALIASLSN